MQPAGAGSGDEGGASEAGASEGGAPASPPLPVLGEGGAQAGEGGAPSGEPLLIAAGQITPVAIAVDAENVYWFNAGSVHRATIKSVAPDNNSSVMKCSRQGCNGKPTALATKLPNADYTASDPTFAVGGGFAFWDDPSGGQSLVRCSVAGCGGKPEVVLTGAVSPLAVDASRLYGASTSGVFTCSISDCMGTLAMLWSEPNAVSMAADASGVYWTTVVAADQVIECPASGCNNTPIVVVTRRDNFGGGERLAVDDENVYIANANGCGSGSIVTCPKSGCPGDPAVLASGVTSSTGIASDGRYVYFTDDGSNSCGGSPDPDSVASPSVRRCSVAGCNDHAETVASGLANPSALAIDDEYVFVADQSAGAIWRIPK
jgi:hypothetical protein